MQDALSEGFSAVLLDFLDDAARHQDKDSIREYYTVLQRHALGNGPTGLRAQAVRLLKRDSAEASYATVEQIIKAGVPDLVNAAAHVVAQWHLSGAEAARLLARELLKYATAQPQRATHCTALCRTLAMIDLPGTDKVLESIVRAAKGSETQRRLLAAVGPKLDAAQLRPLMNQLLSDGSAQSRAVVAGLCHTAPTTLQRLYAAGAIDEYLALLRILPDRATVAEIKYLQRIIGGADAKQRTAAMAILGSRPTLGPITRGDGAHPAPINPPLAKGFSTGFQLADGLYRDLLLQVGNAQHWHTGMFLGFTATRSGNGQLLGINASQGIGWSDTYTFFEATRQIDQTNMNLGNQMQQLRSSFLTAFAEGHENHPFHGSRSLPNLHGSMRRNIYATASAFYAQDIWWTWVDMLDYNGSGWNGSISDIDETRCDGLVEYSYELHGLRVCGGTHPDTRNQWDIALPGTNHPENHNDFHNNAYNPGELCARIQAGDQGSDTQFVTLPAVQPTIDYFGVTPFALFMPPLIYFGTDPPASNRVFARVLVRKKPSNVLHFVRTEDPFGGMDTPVGDWILMEARVPREAAMWMGKTSDGTDFRGQNGIFEFRLQVIDEGGNVSDEQAVEQDIVWP